MIWRVWLPALSAFVLSACQTQSMSGNAALADETDATLSALKSGLAPIVGRASFEFGPSDMTELGQVTVLPPPPSEFETNSLARPTTYQLVLRDGVCFAVSADGGNEAPLPDVACVLISN